MSTYSPCMARKRGPKFKLSGDQAEAVRRKYESGVATVDDIAREAGVTKQTIYNVLRRLRETQS